VVGTSDDVDVTHGLRLLLEQKSFNEIVLPDAEANETHDLIIMTASEKGIPVKVGGTLEEVLASVEEGDVIALAWDDSDDCFEAVEWSQSHKNTLWDISDGLNIVDMETEVLEERLEEVLADFTDTLAALIYKMVMDQIDDDGKRKYRRPE
jgi:hypothetical protein